MSLDLSFLGATGTVTGSKYLLRNAAASVLVDCGLFHGLKALRLRNWAPLLVKPKTVDAVVLTYAHLDHSGSLPEGFTGPVHSSFGTRGVCAILLPDSGHLQEEEARYVMAKTRLGDRRVELQAPPLSQWQDRTPVLLDDIISSARTMALAATRIREAGLSAPVCLGVHAVFSPDALPALRAAGTATIVTSNTIAHETNGIDVAPLVARAIESIHQEIGHAIRIR